MKIITIERLKNFYNLIDTAIVRTGVCESATNETTKVVNVTPGFKTLKPGLQILVKFRNGNESETPLLSVNGTSSSPVVAYTGMLNTEYKANLLSGYCHLVYTSDNQWCIVASGYNVRNPFVFTTSAMPENPEYGTIWLKQK